MSLKWFNKLTKEEILQMHRDCICDDILDTCQINRKDGMCIFLEGGWGTTDEDRACHIETSYKYEDFKVTPWDTYDYDIGLTRQKHFKWMTKRFGREYLVDFLHYKTNIEAEFFQKFL